MDSRWLHHRGRTVGYFGELRVREAVSDALYDEITLAYLCVAVPSLGKRTLTSLDEVNDGCCLVFGNLECEVQELCRQPLQRTESVAVQSSPKSPIGSKVSVVTEPRKIGKLQTTTNICTNARTLVVRLPSVLQTENMPFKNPLIRSEAGEQRVVPRKPNEVATKPLYDHGFMLPRPPCDKSVCCPDFF